MTYYDHATAIAYKLDRWSEERAPRNYELERIARQCNSSVVSSAVSSAVDAQNRNLFRRTLALFHRCRS